MFQARKNGRLLLIERDMRRANNIRGEITNTRVAILYGKVSSDGPEDELDTLDEVKLVRESLATLGYASFEVPVTLDLHDAVAKIKSIDPLVVFNLVESLEGMDSLIYLMPATLDAAGIRYTGCTAESIVITTNKLIAKNVYKLMGLPTPEWHVRTESNAGKVPFAPPYIVKSVWEHASRNLNDASVFDAADALDDLLARTEGEVFVEAFVDGREFNVTMLSGAYGRKCSRLRRSCSPTFRRENPK